MYVKGFFLIQEKDLEVYGKSAFGSYSVVKELS